MAVTTYSPGIETVSGALAKPKKQDGHNHGDYLIGTHRVAPTESSDCNRLYLRKKVERNTPITQEEMGARNRFKTVSAAVSARAKDLSKMTADQAAFKAQKDEPNGKRTMKAYLWKLEGEAYDASH
jgi:hypothetical protein